MWVYIYTLVAVRGLKQCHSATTITDASTSLTVLIDLDSSHSNNLLLWNFSQMIIFPQMYTNSYYNVNLKSYTSIVKINCFLFKIYFMTEH